LVIMGTTSESLGQDLFGHTNTTSLLKMETPVLAVPLGAQFRPVKRVLFACDVVRGINRRILDEVKDVAATFGADVQVFHVQDKVKKLDNDTSAYQEPIKEGLDGIIHTYKGIESDKVID